MCGFAAILSLSGEKPDRGLISRMTGLLRHRGPDDEGVYTDGGFAVGFRRLAILDLAPSGHQPMLSPDRRHVIVFNGEIYNYLELRSELASLGHVFHSSGDTEVLLAAYLQWGRDCLDRLNGMWAFLVYDRVTRHVFGSRDRFGVKPLFVYRNSRYLMFASEIKAIRDSGAVRLSENRQAIANFLLNDRLDDGEQTFYEDVRHVAAGTAFELDDTGKMQSSRFWSLPLIGETPRDPVASFRDLFDDAVRLRMRSDVNVGAQLSGGLDSTSIACSMARQWSAAGRASSELKAFCYLSPEFDETEQIQATLQQTEICQEVLDSRPESLWSSLEKHLWHQDEPVHSFTSVIVYKLMELARSRNVKVLLNGQGADEAWAGYPNFFMDYWLELLRRRGPITANHEILDYARANARSPGTLWMQVLNRYARQSLLHIPGYRSLSQSRRRKLAMSDDWISGDVKASWNMPLEEPPDGLDAVLRKSMEVSALPIYLRVEDRNSMAHGIEVRLPFLDFRLVSLAFGLRSRWKIRGPYSKFLLREAMHGRIPDTVRSRLQKFGFPTSIGSWLRGPLYEPMRDLLSSRIFRESGYWNVTEVLTALDRHKSGDVSCGARLFDVAQLCLWGEGSRTWPNAGT